MNQPPVRPPIERMRFRDRETEHLAGLLDGGDVQRRSQRAVRQLQAVTLFQVPVP